MTRVSLAQLGPAARAQVVAQVAARARAKLAPEAPQIQPAQHAGMNRWEAQWSAELSARMTAGDVLFWSFEPFSLRIASGCRYTPDFLVMRADGTMECHEVKGFMREAARVRLRVAADLHPYRFILVTRPGGQWHTEDIPGLWHRMRGSVAP